MKYHHQHDVWTLFAFSGSLLSSMTADKVSPEFLEAFRRKADGTGRMTFAQFMELALYHPQLGYYRCNRVRIGYGTGTDFFTASTSGPVFGELIVAACVSLLNGRDPREFTFVEIGAEPEGGVLAEVVHPFGRIRNVRPSEPMEILGPCVVFSNELFDAQPFQRFVFRRGAWHERGVALIGNALSEVELPPSIPAAWSFPATAAEGYQLDVPWAANVLADQIASQSWTGLFVAFDYGKSWRELVGNCPAGTARAYYRHTQSNELLDRPGEQDLTCHICWDWLSTTLARRGFSTPTVESQEAFFVKQADGYIATTIATEAARLSPKKLALLQLLHPSHLGQKFQVLHARRDLHFRDEIAS